MKITIFVVWICTTMLWAPTVSANEPDMSLALNFPKEEEQGTVHVEATIRATPEVVWSILTNANRWRQWMPMVMESYFYSGQAAQAIPQQITKDRAFFDQLRTQHPGTATPPPPQGVQSRVTFEAYDLPWPIKNEWVVRRYRYDAARAREHYYRVGWKRVWNQDVPEEGYWELRPHPEHAGATHFTYHFRVKAKRGVALALFKGGVKRSINHFIRAIREQAGNP